jgi:hypothetical protein
MEVFMEEKELKIILNRMKIGLDISILFQVFTGCITLYKKNYLISTIVFVGVIACLIARLKFIKELKKI